MKSTSPTPSHVARLRASLLEWYDRARRDLPWRHTRAPYSVWVSEVMSQQTRVDTVIPYYHRWLARFPDVRALSAADEDEVLRLWQGLGYYSRARNMLSAARAIEREHDGRFPQTADALRALPGVGRYTAGAVASIAFGEATPVVDGNVVRVLSRLFAIDDDARAAATQRRLWSLAGELVPRSRPGDFNQALMELGALVCTPRGPGCDDCPVADLCAGRTRAETLPVKTPKPRPRAEQRFAFAAVAPTGALLVGRNPSGTLLGGMWQYPMHPDEGDPASAFAALTDLPGEVVSEHEPVIHIFSHIRMSVTPVSVSITEHTGIAPTLSGYAEAAWMHPAELASVARSKLVRKLATRFQDGRHAGAHRPNRR